MLTRTHSHEIIHPLFLLQVDALDVNSQRNEEPLDEVRRLEWQDNIDEILKQLHLW